MENKVAQTCRSFAQLFGVLGAIASMALAYQASGKYSSLEIRIDTNWGAFFIIFLAYFLACFISCLLLYAVGEIIQLLEDNRNCLIEIQDNIQTKPVNYNEYNNNGNAFAFEKDTYNINDADKKQVPFNCGSCGYDGPYDGNCPNCNSSIKKYN